MRVFVAGATGLIGRAVCAELLSRGHQVVALSRSAAPRLPPGARAVQGDPTRPGAWQDELAACDACVNFAGEPLAEHRFSGAQKQRIRESRVLSAGNVAAVLAERGPRVLVQGSAVGYYGSRGDEELTEVSPAGQGFLADACCAWEGAAGPASKRARVVLLRSGLVLAREGGALPRMALPFRFLAGGPIGDGSFWQPWIHIADEVGLVLWALGEERVSGPVNASAPAPVRNRHLARAIGKALRRPSLLPAPRLAVRLVLGELAEVVTSSQRVLPARALELGFPFRFLELGIALADLLS